MLYEVITAFIFGLIRPRDRLRTTQIIRYIADEGDRHCSAIVCSSNQTNVRRRNFLDTLIRQRTRTGNQRRRNIIDRDRLRTRLV